MKKLSLIVSGLVLVLGLAGCYESTDVKMHKPGVYEGPKDPLLQGQAARRDQLKKRFTLVQTDR